ncbi:FHA domain-containing protein [Eubacterium ruminantium]|nr:FHA domain-containing protein [Eubacterium ruminantium]
MKNIKNKRKMIIYVSVLILGFVICNMFLVERTVFAMKSVKSEVYDKEQVDEPETDSEVSGSTEATEENISTETDKEGNSEKTTSLKNNTPDSSESNSEELSESFLKKYMWFIIGGAVLLIAMIVTVIMIVVKSGRKKDKIAENEHRTLNGEIRNEPVVQKKIGVPIKMDVFSGETLLKSTTEYINRSSIVGRAENCEITIDDETISRQHFVIEYREGSFYIQDLETTNGTFLNGVRITHKRRLNQDDRIKVGSLEIIVRW